MLLRQKLENELHQFKADKKKELKNKIAALKKAVNRKIEKAAQIKIKKDLISAISTNNSEVVQALVDIKADPNFMYNKDDAGFQGRKTTPLFYAISFNMPNMVETLIAAKADPNLRIPPFELWYQHSSGMSTLQYTYPSQTPLEYAIDHGIYRQMSKEERTQQPVQWSNGAGGCRDVITQEKIITALLKNGAEITDVALENASKDNGLSACMSQAMMKCSFLFFRNNKDQGEMRNKEIPAVEMPGVLTKLIGSYM